MSEWKRKKKETKLDNPNQVLVTCVGDCPDRWKLEAQRIVTELVTAYADEAILAVIVVAVAIVALYALTKRGRIWKS